jgi:hypothetical protein
VSRKFSVKSPKVSVKRPKSFKAASASGTASHRTYDETERSLIAVLVRYLTLLRKLFFVQFVFQKDKEAAVT